MSSFKVYKMNVNDSVSKENRFSSFIRRSISFLSESFEVKNGPKRVSVGNLSPVETPHQHRLRTTGPPSPSKPPGGTTFSDVLFSIDLHMSITQFRILRELKIKGLAVPEDQFYYLLEDLRKQVFNLARDVYRGNGEKIFVHDFLYVEEGHSLRIILPHNCGLSEALYTEWRRIISAFREHVYAVALTARP